MNPLLKNTLFLVFLLSNTVLNAQETDTRVRAEADEDWANGTAKYYFSVGYPLNKTASALRNKRLFKSCLILINV